jgi:hypothetical protein
LIAHKLILAELLAIPQEHITDHLFILMTYICQNESSAIEKYSCFYVLFSTLPLSVDIMQAILASPLEVENIVIDILQKRNGFFGIIQELLSQYNTDKMMDTLMSVEKSIGQSESLVDLRKLKSHDNFKLICHHVNSLKRQGILPETIKIS